MCLSPCGLNSSSALGRGNQQHLSSWNTFGKPQASKGREGKEGNCRIREWKEGSEEEKTGEWAGERRELPHFPPVLSLSPPFVFRMHQQMAVQISKFVPCVTFSLEKSKSLQRVDLLSVK